MNHIFILTPNNSGSTLYRRILRRNKSVAMFEPGGQFSYIGPNEHSVKINLLYCEREYEWTNEDNYDWEESRRIWNSKWESISKQPDKDVKYYMDKSPPFIFIPYLLERHFENTQFILNVRNPYAIASGIMRSTISYYSKDCSATRAAWQAIRCLEIQRKNKETIDPKKYLQLSYENFCDNKEQTIEKIMNFMPHLDKGDLITSMNSSYKIKLHHSTIKNMNKFAISKLSNANIDKINRIFEEKQDVLDYWGYQLIHQGHKKRVPQLRKETATEHIFILSSTNSGGTLYNKIFGTNQAVALLPGGEGHRHYIGPSSTALDAQYLFCEKEYEWLNEENYDWEMNKKMWALGWKAASAQLVKDVTYHMDKSPPHILIPHLLDKHFENARFIINVRNPYAVAAGIMRCRENEMSSPCSAIRAAWQAIRCLEIQQKNTETIDPKKYLQLSYEDFCDKKDQIIERIMNFMPHLDKENLIASLHSNQQHKIKIYNSAIVNMNSSSISELNNKEIHEMNTVFNQKKNVLDYWEYELITAPRHFLVPIANATREIKRKVAKKLICQLMQYVR